MLSARYLNVDCAAMMWSTICIREHMKWQRRMIGVLDLLLSFRA